MGFDHGQNIMSLAWLLLHSTASTPVRPSAAAHVSMGAVGRRVRRAKISIDLTFFGGDAANVLVTLSRQERRKCQEWEREGEKDLE